MRRRVCFICVGIALACPALCLAEAAESLAQSLAELSHRDVIETTDAGCDSFTLGALKAESHPGTPDASAIALPFELTALAMPTTSSLLMPPDFCRRRAPDDRPPTSSRRQASLQLLRL
jgi:hypothetical protein